MNEFLRKNIIAQIEKAKHDAYSVSILNHPGVVGLSREIIIRDLISPLLNSRYNIGKGKVMDFKGDFSKEIDLCIYSNNLLAPIFMSKKDGFGVFPIESVLKCIEVKSNLDLRSLREAYNNFSYLEKTLVMSPGYHDENQRPISHVYIKHKYDLIAFGSKFKNYTSQTLLNVYKQVDPNWKEDPLITSICSIEQGWICFTQWGWLHMPFDNEAQINEEVLGYLSTLLNDLAHVEISRGTPRMGYYITRTNTMEKIK